MAFERFPQAGSQPVAPYISSPSWDGMTFSEYAGYDPKLSFEQEGQMQPNANGNPPFAFASESSSEASPYSYYSSNSEYSTPSPSMIPASPSPSSPSEQIKPTRFHQPVSSHTGAKPKENLTPKQLRRRLQNRVSQQAVRRRRNSPARILETRLQELDKEHSNLMKVYTTNIESCIQTLTAEIKTLRELQGLLQRGTAVPARFDAILASAMFSTGGHFGVSGGGVDQSAAYQNHDFDSSVMRAQY